MKPLTFLAILVLYSSAARAQGASPAGPDLRWLPGEMGSLLETLGVTAGRLALSLGLGLLIGTALAALMRSSRRAESVLTPWLLLLLAIPWLLILISMNVVPGLGVRESTGVGVAALSCAVQVFALGRRKLEEKRETYLRRALWYGFAAITASELLARSDGLGAKIRFYILFTQYDHLLLYVLAAALLWAVSYLLGRLLVAAMGRTFLGRGT